MYIYNIQGKDYSELEKKATKTLLIYRQKKLIL